MTCEQRLSLAFTGSLGLFLLLQAFRVVLDLLVADKHLARWERKLCRQEEKSHFFLSFPKKKMTHEEANKILK